MSPTILIRRVRPTDANVLRDVRLAALADAPGAFGSTHQAESALSDDDWRDRAAAAASGAWRTTLLAWSGADVVGLVGAFRDPQRPDRVDLVSMWTDPAVRRAGVARRLVRAVLDWASSVGATTVELWVTRGNEPAQRLYESMGFVETGAHQPLPSDPCASEIRMSLALGPSGATAPPRTT